MRAIRRRTGTSGSWSLANDCRPNEVPLDWNQRGPQGEPGSVGGAFDERTGEVSTQSKTAVDLGGPSVTIDVPARGLVAVFARADLVGTGTTCAEVLLSGPTSLVNPPMRIIGNCGVAYHRQWTTTESAARLGFLGLGRIIAADPLRKTRVC